MTRLGPSSSTPWPIRMESGMCAFTGCTRCIQMNVLQPTTILLSCGIARIINANRISMREHTFENPSQHIEWPSAPPLHVPRKMLRKSAQWCGAPRANKTIGLTKEDRDEKKSHKVRTLLKTFVKFISHVYTFKEWSGRSRIAPPSTSIRHNYTTWPYNRYLAARRIGNLSPVQEPRKSSRDRSKMPMPPKPLART